MSEEYKIRPIAHIESDFDEKFGIPRQAGIVEALEARIVFEPEFRNADTIRGLEDFSYIWIIWQFSENVREKWSATVRPPRLGGNERKGVFATRSPFRPNALGLSCVKLLAIEPDSAEGPILLIGGADMMNGTPVYDIKPYIPYADSHPDARSGFAPDSGRTLEVCFESGTEERVPEDKREAVRGVLANDPRPRYQNDPERRYGMTFAGLEIRFRVEQETVIVEKVEENLKCS